MRRCSALERRMSNRRSRWTTGLVAAALVLAILVGYSPPWMLDLRAGTVARARTEMQLRTGASAIEKLEDQPARVNCFTNVR